MCERASSLFFYRNHAFIYNSDTLNQLGTLSLIGTIKKVKRDKFFEEQVRKRLGTNKHILANAVCKFKL